jgi:hypothetical protein
MSPWLKGERDGERGPEKADDGVDVVSEMW